MTEGRELDWLNLFFPAHRLVFHERVCSVTESHHLDWLYLQASKRNPADGPVS